MKWIPIIKERRWAATWIQVVYKRRLRNQAKFLRESRAATLIQKLLRGYIQNNRIIGAVAT